MAPKQLLIVEDDPSLATALDTIAKRLGHSAVVCYSGGQAMDALAQEDAEFALAILDIGLPDINGIDLLAQIKESRPTLNSLIITAHGNLDNAIAAKRLGAIEFLVKPFDSRLVEDAITNILDADDLPDVPPAPASDSTTPSSILIGASPAMQRILVKIAQACVSQVNVLMSGPTGSGKTLAARIIHANGTRHDKPFVVLHCGALPEQLLESELFGHEKNSFTGAGERKLGHCERAHGGTLLLDEIGDVSPTIQSKLLRFVDEKTFSRVGGREDLSVDTRLIAATNKDMRKEVKQGRFREDLYYRLRVLEIEMPPLADRKEDLPALCAFFLRNVGPEPPQLAAAAVRLLHAYDWPGNIRELQNALQHAAATSAGKVVLPHHLPQEIRETPTPEPADDDRLREVLEQWLEAQIQLGEPYAEISDALEAMVLRKLLAHFDHKPTVLSRELKMNRATLLKKRKQFGLEK